MTQQLIESVYLSKSYLKYLKTNEITSECIKHIDILSTMINLYS